MPIAAFQAIRSLVFAKPRAYHLLSKMTERRIPRIMQQASGHQRVTQRSNILLAVDTRPYALSDARFAVATRMPRIVGILSVARKYFFENAACGGRNLIRMRQTSANVMLLIERENLGFVFQASKLYAGYNASVVFNRAISGLIEGFVGFRNKLLILFSVRLGHCPLWRNTPPSGTELFHFPLSLPRAFRQVRIASLAYAKVDLSSFYRQTWQDPIARSYTKRKGGFAPLEDNRAGSDFRLYPFRGGDDGIRTHDPHVAYVMLSQEVRIASRLILKLKW